MDLRSYIESEVQEDRTLPGGGAVARSEEGGYPGDPQVHVPESAVDAQRVRIPGAAGEQEVYVVRPRAGGPAPAVVLVHENKGLVPYITDTARRLAAAGYVAVAPDLLSRLGGTAAFDTQDDVTAALATIDAADVTADVRGVIGWAADQDFVRGDRIGILGFCYGGGVAWRVLTQDSRLTAGVPFYGPIPDVDAVAGISAAVLAIYGEKDERITSMLPVIQEAMQQHGKTFQPVILQGAGHAFHNDTNADRYHPEAAREAWRAAVAWLDRWLGEG